MPNEENFADDPEKMIIKIFKENVIFSTTICELMNMKKKKKR